MSTSFVPPKPEEWQGPAQTGSPAGFVPPPPTAWQGPAKNQSEIGNIPDLPPSPSGFGESLWNELKRGPGNLAALGNALLHPVSAMKGLIQQNSELGQAAINEWKSGNHGEAIRAGINYLLNTVPGMGTGLQEAGTKMEHGNIGGGLGQTLGVGTNVILGAKTPQIARGVARSIPRPGQVVPDYLQASPKNVNLESSMTNALSPKPANTDFTDNLETTMRNIKAANGGVTPKTDRILVQASEKAIDLHQRALDQWVDRAERGGVQIPLDPIAKATMDAIPKPILPSEVGRIQALIQEAQQDFGGRTWTPKNMRDWLIKRNKEVRTLENSPESAQNAATLAGKDIALMKVQRDAGAEIFAQAIDPEGQGANVRTIQSQTSHMMDIRDAAAMRKIPITKEQPPTAATAYRKAATAVPTTPLKAMFHEDPLMLIPKAFHGVSNPLIKTAFDAIRGEPNAIPLPETPQFPYVPAGRQLAQGGRISPSTAGSVSATGMPPQWQQQAWQGVNAPKQLPPATTRITPPSEAGGLSPTTSSSPLRSGTSPTPSVSPAPPPQQGVSGNIPPDIQALVQEALRKGGFPGAGEEIPKFARGGIITKPTLGIIGEESPEARIPLTAGSHSIPESPETIGSQVADLTSGRRRVVMLPKGSPRLALWADKLGNLFLFDPEMISRNQIYSAVVTNNLPRILGPRGGLGVPDKSKLHGSPVVVQASRKGVPVQDTLSDKTHLKSAVRQASKLAPSVRVRPPASVIADRLGSPRRLG